MTDDTALLAAIRAAPEDDAPRLAYADWCDEHGRPERAEFIRVQVELARRFGGTCRACGKPLSDDRIADGCPCNSPRGVNHGIVPAYVCTCQECDPQQTGSTRGRPADVDALWRREGELWRSLGDSFDVGRIESRLPWESGIDRENGICVVRRGFVESVRLTCGQFCGGVEDCRHCFGEGDGVDETGCRHCLSTGKAPGLAASLFSQHPITAVVLTDREPQPSAYGPDGRCAWQCSDRDLPSWVPYGLLEIMAELEEEDLDGQTWRVYPTRDLALAALSAAAVAYGRAAAELPELEASR